MDLEGHFCTIWGKFTPLFKTPIQTFSYGDFSRWCNVAPLVPKSRIQIRTFRPPGRPCRPWACTMEMTSSMVDLNQHLEVLTYRKGIWNRDLDQTRVRFHCGCTTLDWNLDVERHSVLTSESTVISTHTALGTRGPHSSNRTPKTQNLTTPKYIPIDTVSGKSNSSREYQTTKPSFLDALSCAIHHR